MSRFVGDMDDFRRPGEPRRMLVTRDLLMELGVAELSREEQERAVQHWLQANRPHQVLALSLRKDGFDVDGQGIRLHDRRTLWLAR